MKRNNFMVLLAVMVLTLSSVFAYAPAGSVSAKTGISKKKLTMKVSETYILKLKGAKGKIIWKSSRPKVAKVSKIGKVTALKKGKAAITAKSTGKKYKCSVIVKKNNQKDFATSVPAEPTPTPKPSENISTVQMTNFMQCINYRVTNIEDEYISVERIDDTKVDYTKVDYSYDMNEKERLLVDNRVLVFSNGKIILLEKGQKYSEDFAGLYIEGDRMEYRDIKIGDIVDIIYLEDYAKLNRESFGCRVINVKR